MDTIDSYVPVDLTETFPVEAITDAVIHLAGLAAVGPSFTAPQSYIETNSSMMTNVCETLLRQDASSETRLITVSSGAMYAPSQKGAALREDSPLAFSSPYVVSKVLVENQAAYYRSRGVQAIIARPFNHIGPGQRPGFLVPDLWARLEALRPGEPLKVGNLETARDYLDVRDVAEAYIALATCAAVQDETYNVCSGTATTGLEILSKLCLAAEIPLPELSVQAHIGRPNDPNRIVGSPEKLMEQTNWHPHKTIDDSLRDFIDGFQS